MIRARHIIGLFIANVGTRITHWGLGIMLRSLRDKHGTPNVSQSWFNHGGNA